jgi:hypothetical protein
MSKTMTRAEFAAGVERFKQACIHSFNIKYQWPPVTDQHKAAHEEYHAAFDAIQDVELSDGKFSPGHTDGGDCSDRTCICQRGT